MPLVFKLQQLFRGFTYEVTPIMIGTLRAIPKALKQHLEDIGLMKDRYYIIRRKQLAVLKVIVKDVKTFCERIKDIANFETKPLKPQATCCWLSLNTLLSLHAYIQKISAISLGALVLRILAKSLGTQVYFLFYLCLLL